METDFSVNAPNTNTEAISVVVFMIKTLIADSSATLLQ